MFGVGTLARDDRANGQGFWLTSISLAVICNSLRCRFVV
jgi:hypothetical protein